MDHNPIASSADSTSESLTQPGYQKISFFNHSDQNIPSCAGAQKSKQENALVHAAGVMPITSDYARVILFFSGGKDSIASYLYLIENGVHPSKIEIHHHLVDGREGSVLFDWPVTESYCKAFAKAFGSKYYASWKMGGLEREMLRENQLTAPIAFEREDGTISVSGGERGELSTRLKFPQTVANLQTRWCSAYGKIDVGSRVLTKELRFLEGKTLVITGERAEESSSRANYKTFEPHRADNRNGKRIKRYIDHFRPVHGWSEQQVWEIIARHKVNPHPSYKIGFGRVSCMNCIFESPNQRATVRKYMPVSFLQVAGYEQQFGVTIARKETVNQVADRGTPYNAAPDDLMQASSFEYTDEIIVSGVWVLPLGAFGESDGPT